MKRQINTNENEIKLSTLKASNTVKKEHIKLGFFADFLQIFISIIMRLTTTDLRRKNNKKISEADEMAS